MHMSDYIDVNKLKTEFPDVVWHIPPETTCIWLYMRETCYTRVCQWLGMLCHTDSLHRNKTGFKIGLWPCRLQLIVERILMYQCCWFHELTRKANNTADEHILCIYASITLRQMLLARGFNNPYAVIKIYRNFISHRVIPWKWTFNFLVL